MMTFSNNKNSDIYFYFLEKALSINSTTGNEMEMALFLKNFIERSFKPDKIDLQEVKKNRFNIIAVKGEPKFFMSTHIDTVPEYFPPYFIGEKIYGRGACDAKGQIATQLWALDDLLSKGLTHYGLLYVIGEEVDSIGAFAALSHPFLSGEYLLSGEPTENIFASSSMGIMELIVEAEGIASHSSQVPLDSAVHKLCHDVVNILTIESCDLLLNVGTISGGIASNVTASRAIANLCVRYNGDPKIVFQKIKTIAKSKCVCRGDYVLPSGFFIPKGFENQSGPVPFCSDATIFKERFKYVMLFGPGSIKNAHQRNEYICRTEMVEGKDMIVAAIQSILNRRLL